MALRVNGIKNAFRIHQLVMLAFEGPMPDDCECILHLDDDPSNNAFNNLRYGTNQENIKDSINKGRHCMPIGRKRIRLLVTELQTGKEIFFETLREASKQLKINESRLYAIFTGVNRNTTNYSFKRA